MHYADTALPTHVCILCHLYVTGVEVKVLEFVLSSAACFCFFKMTSWSFCLTSELATAPYTFNPTKMHRGKKSQTFS